MKNKLIPIILSLYSTHLWATNDSNSQWNLGLKLGILAEELTRPKTNEERDNTDSFILGGVPLGLGLFKDISEDFTVVTWASLLLDIPNRLLSRQGVEAGIDYHLFGGGKRSITGGSLASIVSENTSQLSFAIRTGMFHYAAATKDGRTKVTGATFEFHTGLIFRSGSYGIGLMNSFLSLPASTELLAAKSVELSVFWVE